MTIAEVREGPYRAATTRVFEEGPSARARAARIGRAALGLASLGFMGAIGVFFSGITLGPCLSGPSPLHVAVSDVLVAFALVSSVFGIRATLRARRPLQRLSLGADGLSILRGNRAELFVRWDDLGLAHSHGDGSAAFEQRRTGHRLRVVSSIARDPAFLDLVLTSAARTDERETSVPRAERRMRPSEVASVTLERARGPRLVDDTRVRLVRHDGQRMTFDAYGPEAFEFAVAAVRAGAVVA